jgi:hypothetical protein
MLENGERGSGGGGRGVAREIKGERGKEVGEMEEGGKEKGRKGVQRRSEGREREGLRERGRNSRKNGRGR